jgi:hypothetical protein
MNDKFDPTTNRAPWGLLTEQERNVLTEWPHGIEFFGGARAQGWFDTNTTTWNSNTVYRGKPAPVVTSKWFNIYPDGTLGTNWGNRKQADGCPKARVRIAVLRIDTYEGVSTAHLEEL